MKLLFALALSSIFILSSCKKDKIGESTINASIKSGETYIYDTGYGGDEQGAFIHVQAKHYEISEMKRDSSTHHSPVYFYKAKDGFKGNDEVVIRTSDLIDLKKEKSKVRDIRIKLTVF